MEDSLAKTFSIPDGTQSNNPAPVARAVSKPVRVVFDNVGPNVLLLGFAPGDVLSTAGGQGNTAYRLAPGESRVIVLAPKQSLYAMGIGFGGRASIIQSEAFPAI